MSRSVTVYRENKATGEVEKIDVTNRPDSARMQFLGMEGVNYHENIIRTYHELECQGKLRDMGPREKRAIRDLHTHAQNPAFWPSHYTKDERGV